ncbi:MULTISPECIES: acyltransferase [Cupriavidus]
MAYLTEEQLKAVGFKFLGKNIKISDKAAIYDADRIEIGDYSRIDDFCVLSGKLRIGRNVHIAIFCNLAGGEQGIVVEDFSGISYGSQVFSQSDDYSGRALTGPTVPVKYRKETKKAVHIKRHCIVGAGSVIFPGVVLGEGTSVGALSLISKSTEEWSVYIGVPARKIKDRERLMLELEKEYVSEYPGQSYDDATKM